jgi:hypothetical protein
LHELSINHMHHQIHAFKEKIVYKDNQHTIGEIFVLMPTLVKINLQLIPLQNSIWASCNNSSNTIIYNLSTKQKIYAKVHC